jgi:hypothetical protein
VSELVPYEIPPVDPGDDELTVHLGSGGGEPERLLRISRPVDGLVRVREFSGDDWSAPFERELSAEALLRAFEEAARQRRKLSEELYRIRLWLTGAGG